LGVLDPHHSEQRCRPGKAKPPPGVFPTVPQPPHTPVKTLKKKKQQPFKPGNKKQPTKKTPQKTKIH
ncbi:hypothetical protein, partial [Enterobacter intestinihominis]